MINFNYRIDLKICEMKYNRKNVFYIMHNKKTTEIYQNNDNLIEINT